MIRGELLRMFVRRHRPAAVLVALAAGILAFCLTALFPAAGLPDATRLSATWPPLMKDLFGDPIHGFTSVYGWLHLQVFHITSWVLMGGLASVLAVSIVAKEVEDRTLDTLLACPITRSELIVSRLAGLGLMVACAALALLVGCAVGIGSLGRPVMPFRLIAVCLQGTLLALVFAGTTLLVSTLIPNRVAALAIAWTLLALLFLHEEVLIRLVPALGALSFVSPFHFYGAGDILIRGSFRWADSVALLCTFLTLSGLSVLVFSRRDVPT